MLEFSPVMPAARCHGRADRRCLAALPAGSGPRGVLDFAGVSDAVIVGDGGRLTLQSVAVRGLALATARSQHGLVLSPSVQLAPGAHVRPPPPPSSPAVRGLQGPRHAVWQRKRLLGALETGDAMRCQQALYDTVLVVCPGARLIVMQHTLLR